ncbi:hypothetical protein [Cupriavidus numazuensis]|uniref:Uncharacterized protein n=1 Tax=Cupriavidus numazuensis TaxID=221992 RepID=A0ABN7QHL5_9BURK|nr:hypothetical protein [Cupriavidus numazuensis]CAG2161351.1 hypothetical protein LMG26411_08176 [Cupriavidus numazuensis]
MQTKGKKLLSSVVAVTQEYLEDVVESHNRYCEWVQGGRENEDLGDELLDELKERLTNFFFVAGDLDPISVRMGKGSSGMQLTVRGNKLGITCPRALKKAMRKSSGWMANTEFAGGLTTKSLLCLLRGFSHHQANLRIACASS